MAISLIAHGYHQGGSTTMTPCYNENILDTRGGNFLFTAASSGAETISGLPLVDTAGNTWTAIPGYPSSGDGHSGNTCQSRYYWTIAPITSATDAQRVTTVNCGGLNCSMISTAWNGVKQSAPFDTQIWGTSLTQSVAVSAGLVITACLIGFGDGNTGSNVPTVSAGWTLIDRAPSIQGPPSSLDPMAGLSLAYKILGAPATASVTWTVPGTVVSGTAVGIFSFLAETGPPPPPTPTTYAIRRLRRFMLPWDDQNRQKFISRLELVMQAGIGTASITSPTVMLRLSPDGGITWGHEQQMSAGALGDYSKRVFLNRLGRARNPVVEITVSDPVSWQFVQFLADMEVGMS